MHLDGTRILNISRQEVWKMLLDPGVLARTTPGVKRLEPDGEDSYTAVFEIRMGPVNGSFKGKLAVTDKIELRGYTLKMNLNGRIGNVAAEGKLNLKPVNSGQTEVSFSGDAQLTGTLARTGQRVLSGVANTMTTQFFASLEREIDGAPAKKTGFWQRIKQWVARLFGKNSA